MTTNVEYKWLVPDWRMISCNWELNPRTRDEDHIHDIAKHMNEHGYDENYPIVVYKITTAGYNKDLHFAATGMHRLEAAQLKSAEYPNLPLERVYCEVRKGTAQDYVRCMLQDNFQHTPSLNRQIGKMPTRDEIRNMRFQLMHFPDIFKKGDRLLGKEWGCDGKVIGKLRDEIVGNIQAYLEQLSTADYSAVPSSITKDDVIALQKIIEEGKYVGADGKSRPRQTQKSAPTLDTQAIKTEVSNGDSFIDIATRHNTTTTEVMRVSNEVDIPAPKTDAVRADIEQARKDHDNGNGGGVNGVKYKPIADKHGVSVEEVAAIAKGKQSTQDREKYYAKADKELMALEEAFLAEQLPMRLFEFVQLACEKLAYPMDMNFALNKDVDAEDILILESNLHRQILDWDVDMLKLWTNRFRDIRSAIENKRDWISDLRKDDSVSEEVAAVPTVKVCIRGIDIWIDNPDLSKSYPEIVHFCNKESKHVVNHPLTDIPAALLSELQIVVEKALAKEQSQ